jgi:hypothetical protein
LLTSVVAPAATLQMVEADDIGLASPSFQNQNRWGKVQMEMMKPSTAKLMTGLMSIGLKSLEAVDHETQSAGGDAEWAAKQALVAIREQNSY